MAASERHSDSDGSDIFWPGYVDAVTNLVLNLLFLLTIMTVAVFMFALELGRASKGGPSKPALAAVKQESLPADPAKENIELKREIQRLKMELDQRSPKPIPSAQPIKLAKAVDVTSNVPKPSTAIDRTVASDTEIIVRFVDEAVAFTALEHDRLLETLKSVVANGKATIRVEVPPGFSEAKRMGFYRAMAVRNLLIEMKMPQESINVSVVEGKGNANASIVKVK